MSEQTITNKPEVFYTGPLIITEWLNSYGETTSIFVGRLQQVLNHPVLGKCYDVRTSNIVVWPDDNGNFETRNTKYIRTHIEPASKSSTVNEPN